MSSSSSWSERNRAGALIDAGQAAAGLRILGPLLAAEPDDVAALQLASLAQQRLERFRDSLDTAHAAIRVAPDDDVSWRLAAHAAAGLELSEEATDAAARACRLGPYDWQNHYTRVVVDCNAYSASPETAISVDELGRLAPARLETRIARALLADARGDWAAAEEHYRQALALEPNHAMALNNLAAALANQNKFSAATAGFTRTLGTDPTMSVASWNMVRLGRSMMFRLGMFAALAAFLVWIAVFAASAGPVGSTRAAEVFGALVVAGLVVLVVVQVLRLRRALGSRSGAVLSRLLGDRPIQLSSVLLLVVVGLCVISLVIPPEPALSPAGPAILAAVIGAYAARSLQP